MISKNELRQVIFKKRQQLSQAYRQEAQNKIYQQVFDLPLFKAAKSVLIYTSTEEEMDTRPIIEEGWKLGKTMTVPRVYPKRQMEAHVITPDSTYQVSKFGIPEPLADSPIIDPQDLDLIIMPCVSCNNQGQRIGYGGGFYDCFLLRAKNVPVILPYFAKLQSEEIPTEDHDQTADVVITEEGTIDLRSKD